MVLESWGNLYLIPIQWDCNLIPFAFPQLLADLKYPKI